MASLRPMGTGTVDHNDLAPSEVSFRNLVTRVVVKNRRPFLNTAVKRRKSWRLTVQQNVYIIFPVLNFGLKTCNGNFFFI